MKKWLAIGIILLFVGTCIIPAIAQDIEKSSQPTSRGNWLYVGGSGPGNYSKIQDAINDSSNGDTVFVYDDSSPYYENVVVNKSIDLVGEDRNSTVVDGGRNGDVVFISADNISIDGFTIQNSGDKYDDAGVHLRSNFSIVRNMKIWNDSRGIYLYHSCNNQVVNNTINQNREEGVVLGFHSDYNMIYGNIIGWLNRVGVELLASNMNNTFSYNVIEQNQDEGVILFTSHNNRFLSNTIRRNGQDGIFIHDSMNNNITKNTINANGGSGVSIQSVASPKNSILKNTISYNYYGIFFLGISNTTISENIITGNTYGIGLEGSLNNTILKNFFTENNIAIRLVGSIGTLVSENSINGNSEGVNLKDCLKTEISFNNFQNNSLRNALFFNSSNTLWISNYWNRPRILPKPIFGVTKIKTYPFFWINFDWHPAQVPYDISEMS